MTVASQVKQTYASLKGACATIKMYGEYHPDPEIKALFSDCHEKLERITRQVEKRVGQIEREEPQFKGF
ncbi:DUF1657 domain-containing protein [Alkaliphilus crotonatoxidans]